MSTEEPTSLLSKPTADTTGSFVQHASVLFWIKWFLSLGRLIHSYCWW
jgi:hypothetical protein